MLCHSYCFSTATMVARTRLNVTLYLHCLSCLYLSSSDWKLESICVRPPCCSSTFYKFIRLTVKKRCTFSKIYCHPLLQVPKIVVSVMQSTHKKLTHLTCCFFMIVGVSNVSLGCFVSGLTHSPRRRRQYLFRFVEKCYHYTMWERDEAILCVNL